METPVYDFIRQYAAQNNLRLHMPGHKGNGSLGVEMLDITEITGADVLYHESGILKESQENAAKLFGTAKTLYSTEGSSLSIRAMLYLVKLHAGQKCTILAGRNAHKTFIHAAALLNIPVEWLYPEKSNEFISCTITPEGLENRLSEMSTPPTAVYITSPDYLGNLADISRLAQIAHRYGAFLLVDNAHGAYLNFLPKNQHPIALGADCCCDSAHKTLPVLTGGGYLHISAGAPESFIRNAPRGMAIFASTSPSYLILQSLDLANRYLAKEIPSILSTALPVLKKAKATLQQHGWCIQGDEPLKITLLPKEYGYTGHMLGDVLEKNQIFPEFADNDHIVFMLSPEKICQSTNKLVSVLTDLPRRKPITTIPPILSKPSCRISPSEAIYLPAEEVPVAQSLEKVMAAPCVSCPPAIPIVSIGEEIDENAIAAMEYYGIDHVTVLA